MIPSILLLFVCVALVAGVAPYLAYRHFRRTSTRSTAIGVAVAVAAASAVAVFSLVRSDERGAGAAPALRDALPRLGDVPSTSGRPEAAGGRARRKLVDFYSVDEMLDALEWGATAFNVPPTMNLDSAADIHLVLLPSDTTTREYLVGLVKPAGAREFVKVRVSPRMQATLTSAYFEIVSHNPAEQAVSAETPTEWKWTVKPHREGDWPLTLTLDAFVDVAGRESPRTVESMERTIQVSVTRSQALFGFLNDHWEFLLGSILLPTSLWLIGRRFRTPRQVARTQV